MIGIRGSIGSFAGAPVLIYVKCCVFLVGHGRAPVLFWLKKSEAPVLEPHFSYLIFY